MDPTATICFQVPNNATTVCMDCHLFCWLLLRRVGYNFFCFYYLMNSVSKYWLHKKICQNVGEEIYLLLILQNQVLCNNFMQDTWDVNWRRKAQELLALIICSKGTSGAYKLIILSGHTGHPCKTLYNKKGPLGNNIITFILKIFFRLKWLE